MENQKMFQHKLHHCEVSDSFVHPTMKLSNGKNGNGESKEVPMWKYWFLQEGVLGVDKDFLKTNDGKLPPVTHVDTTAPLYSDLDGKLITNKIGIKIPIIARVFFRNIIN